MKRFYALLAVCLVLVTACASGTKTETSAQHSIDYDAFISHEDSMVILPADRLLLTEVERRYLLSTFSAAMNVCAQHKGVALRDVKPSDKATVEESFREFGPWNREFAQKYAFLKPGTEGQMRVNYGREGTLLLPPTEEEEKAADPNSLIDAKVQSDIREECNDAGERFYPGHYESKGPWLSELSAQLDSLKTDKEIKPILRELQQCYEAAGIEWDDQYPGQAKNVSYKNLRSEDIALAVKAAECHEKLKATERIVKRWAELQKPIIEKYADELVADRKKIDTVMKEAREYVAAHPEVFVDEQEIR